MVNRLVRVGSVIAALLFSLQAFAAPTAAQTTTPAQQGFVTRSGSKLLLNGKTFRFAGSNNYYLVYQSQAMADDVLEKAAANGYQVMRLWGSIDIGNQDGSNSINGKANGIYFQYFDPATGQPAYNDGADGLQRLDYVLAKAQSLGLKVVIPFVNNWNNFGGMDQYVRWKGGQYHDEFYTDPTIRAWYQGWISHLLNRTNSITGVQYKNDPTIMTWELGNEPRCKSAGVYPQSDACTTQTITDWADEMSTYIKTIDQNHLVSVGDEGFYCDPNAANWIDRCGEGVDTLALTALPNIDVMSLHLYPEGWGQTTEWATEFLVKHVKDARKLKKPVMLGEFGLTNKATRNPIYQTWTDEFYKAGGNGALFWMLAGAQDNGTLYPDYDGHNIYCPSPICTTIANFAKKMGGKATTFPPVADDDLAETAFGTPVSITPLGNDIRYGGATISYKSLDLDPATAGRQTSYASGSGSFVLQADGTILFTPASGFSGKAKASYTIKDSSARLSNVATILITVKPDPNGALTLFSFEDGTESWGPASWQASAGSVAQTSSFVTHGSYGLHISASEDAWFGLQTSELVNLTGKTELKYDIKTGDTGVSSSVALQLGDSWDWCQGPWNWVNSGTSTTVTVDLTALTCTSGGAPNLSQLRAFYIYFGAGQYDIDNIRAQ